MNPVPAPVREGEILAGKYRVERVLGVGGMGVVVAARHLQLDQLVALKFMLPSVLGNKGHVARFLQEARSAVKLKNEHVARVIDLGTLENGSPFIVFEYLEGADLSALLKKHGPMPAGLAVDYLLQVLEAMGEAHSLNIIHRDLKPTNLFLVRRPDGSSSLKVLDFGISKVTGGEELAVTSTQAILGTPSYMSPEQMRSSRNVDCRTDIWALGAILFKLVSDKVPFPGETITELCVRVLQEPPTPLSELGVALPPGLEEVIQHCLEKDRDRRFGNVAELAAALEPFASSNARGTAQRISAVLQIAQPRPTTPTGPGLRPSAQNPLIRSSPSFATPSSQMPLVRSSPSLGTPSSQNPLVSSSPSLEAKSGGGRLWIVALLFLLSAGAGAAWIFLHTAPAPAVIAVEKTKVSPPPIAKAPPADAVEKETPAEAVAPLIAAPKAAPVAIKKPAPIAPEKHAPTPVAAKPAAKSPAAPRPHPVAKAKDDEDDVFGNRN